MMMRVKLSLCVHGVEYSHRAGACQRVIFLERPRCVSVPVLTLAAISAMILELERKFCYLACAHHYTEELVSEIKRIPTPYSYSSAVVAGDYVFLGLHRGFGDSFSDQIEDALANITRTLAELNLTLENLVKIQVWLKHVSDLPEMERRFHSHFEQDRFPARMTSTTEFIDADCLVMLEGVAYITR